MPETRTDVLNEQVLDETPCGRDVLDENLGVLVFLLGAAAEPDEYRALPDDRLLELTRLVAEQKRLVGGHETALAGEVARRSNPALGYQGLAQSLGHRTAEELMRVTTGSTLRDARTTVEVGRMVAESLPPTERDADPRTGELPPPVTPWLGTVARSVAAGGLSVAQAAAIKQGLGTPSDAVSVDQLENAAEELRLEALAGLDADRLRQRAAEVRDELDEAGVADRERARRDRRSFKLFRQADGMTRAEWLMDDETAAVVRQVFDRATSPKLGGPRFVDSERADRAESIERDPRTPVQLASDVFLELIRAGAEVDPSQLLGRGAPGVRVLVHEDDLLTRTGHGWIEGQNELISISTVERLICGSGIRHVVFDPSNRPLDVGRDERYFTEKQRIAIATRDGGCMWPGCGRPPSWSEAHHIDEWVRDHGESNVDDGVLLCRHHHQLLHANGWRIVREGTNYSLIPPPMVDPGQIPIRLRTKSPAYAAFVRANDPR